MTKEKLNQILENHKHWINEDCEDWEYMEADLRGKDLNDLDLSGASLENTNLSKVMLILTHILGKIGLAAVLKCLYNV